MSFNENSTIKADVYTKVTSAIIAAIEQGAGQYKMPWSVRQDKGFSPVSVGSGKPYRGINTLVLWAQAQTNSYDSSLWGTYQQWLQLGGQVRKGEKGSVVTYWGTLNGKTTDADEGDAKSERHLFCKGYTVFNLLQVDNCKLPKRFDPKLSHNQRIERADAFFDGLSGLQVKDGGNRAYYRPDTDGVYMPGYDQFSEPKAYYSTLAHEVTHWSSHPSRCNRELGKRFGDNQYAVEELVAELGSAYTMAHLELESTPRLDHAQYIESWLKVLKSDKKAIFTAASQAQKAADFLIKQSVPTLLSQGVAA